MAVTSVNKSDKISSEEDRDMKFEFEDFILVQNHPCVMAQSVVSQKQVDFYEYGELGSKTAAAKILEDIKVYLEKYDFKSNEFFTFVAAFKDKKNYTEEEFEDKLWQQLQFIHEADDIPWDPNVSSDAENPNFSFSIAGKAFFIVGMHPQSSRMARQSPFPMVVFNLHWQFEKLREMGAYQNVRDKIRERDMELQGSINPMVRNFGEKSETRQYSGREVGEEWKCPFHQQSLKKT